MTRPLDLADELAQLVNPQPQQDLDPEAAGLGDGDLLNPAPLDPQLAALLGDAGAAAAGRRRGVAADIALEGGAYRGRVSSRAALFGDVGIDAADISEEGGSEDGSEGEQEEQDEEEQDRGRPQFTSPSRLRTVAVSPSRDVSQYKTMFVNGHHHPGAPGKDDTTDTSSTSSGDGGDSDTEQQQQQQDEQQAQQMNGHHAQVVHQQQQHVGGEVQHIRQPARPAAGRVTRSQQQLQQLSQEAAGEEHEQHKQLSDEDAGNAQQQQRRRQQQQGAGSSDGELDEQEQSEEESEDQQSGDESLGDGEPGSSDEGSEEEEEAGGRMDVDDAMPAAAGAGEAGVTAADRIAAAAAAAAMLGEAAEMQELEREAATVRAEGEQQLMAAASGGDRQAAKAAGVRAQQRLWGSALEMRIRLQKAVSGANRLPRPAAAAAFKASNSAVADSYQQLRSACQETLESMLQLHDALAQQHPAAAAALEAAAAAKQQQQQPAAAAAVAAGSKRSLAAAGLDAEPGIEPNSTRGKYTGSCSTAAAAWAAVDSTIESLAGFRDASLDKWHRRTVLSSGTAALRGSSGLRALQQSISTQVSQLMSADRAKLIARSQLPVQLAPRPLGQPAAADGQQQQGGADEEGSAARGHERARDPETYDEGDFYSQLLKELLESAPAGSVPSQLAAARPAKRRKMVDRRASKGRKLRFHTMDKLVGFMAPKELVLPPFAEQLFGNLFSHAG